MQPFRNTASSARRRSAPLRTETSHDLIHALPASVSSEIGHLSSSLINFSSRESAGVGRELGETSLSYDRNDEELRLSTVQYPFVSGPVSTSLTDLDPMPGTSDVSISMLAPEQASFLGNHFTLEECLRVLRHNATETCLPGPAILLTRS